MRMISNGGGYLSFQFDPASDKFKYLRTNTLYPNTTVGINSLLAAANTATPIVGGGDYYYADFNVGTTSNYLYLIWDFRNSEPVSLCYSATSDGVATICCDCDPCSDPCKAWMFKNVGSGTAQVQYTDCNGVVRVLSINQNTKQQVCALASVLPTVLSGNLLITVVQECGCPN
jgi:hypothetical protein